MGLVPVQEDNHFHFYRQLFLQIQLWWLTVVLGAIEIDIDGCISSNINIPTYQLGVESRVGAARPGDRNIPIGRIDGAFEICRSIPCQTDFIGIALLHENQHP